MKKLLMILITTIIVVQPSLACNKTDLFKFNFFNNEEKAVKKVLSSQVKYANNTNFEKFIATFDPKYVNSDGFNLDIYSSLIKDIWDSYDNIKYEIKFKNVSISDNKATVELTENSYADLKHSGIYEGELKSEANTIYHLKKNNNGKWKVISDTVIDETTTMLYGEARDLDITLSVPNPIAANTDYTASLEFIAPDKTIAIASIASDKVEYPQKQTEEVFRAMPEDNILERIFTSNNENANEYVIASIGLTKPSVSDSNIRLNLTGFGYTIKRVNVIHEKGKTISDDKIK